MYHVDTGQISDWRDNDAEVSSVIPSSERNLESVKIYPYQLAWFRILVFHSSHRRFVTVSLETNFQYAMYLKKACLASRNWI